MAETDGASESKAETSKNIFRNLAADDPDPETTQIESLCMNCGENGVTKLLLTKIPHYKDIVLMSFECERCGYRNNEVQSGGKIMERGVKITVKIADRKDLDRRVVKSDYTGIKIPSLGFEIPAGSQKGEVTTIEGILERSIDGLEQDQPRRKESCPDQAEKIDLFIEKLRGLKAVNEPYTILFEDISGECHVENPNGPYKDTQCEIVHFKRSKEQDASLGIYPENEDVLLKPLREGEHTLEQIEGEVLSFPTNCPDCNSPCETNMKLTNIPHFKEVVIMATLCESCGHRTNEVKSGGGIEPKGVRIEVRVAGKKDFSRDLLKSETCRMEIPELELEIGPTTLGGRFTTVEGIIVATKEQLSGSTAFIGDSNDPQTLQRMEKFLSELQSVLDGERHVTLVLDDPAGNSYVQSLSEDEHSDDLDDGLKIVKYERTFEQNEELGLNDMNVDNY